MKYIHFILLIVSILGCSERTAITQKQNEKSKIMNNTAMRIYKQNVSNYDSLKKALNLIDSALTLNENYSYLTNKYAIARRLGEYKVAQIACDRALALRKNDYSSLIHKGYVFEDTGKKDSAKLYYSKAYYSVDTAIQFIGNPMMKVRQQIIITELLEDTATYRELLNKYVKDFNKEKNYSSIFEELKIFDRQRYLSNL